MWGMKLAVLVVAAAASATAALDLKTVILRPAQVGKGYQLVPRQDGYGPAAAPTLDLCGSPKTYASEKLRSDRLQVNYLKANTAMGLSNEVVTYKGAGAVQAMREVQRHADNCPAKPIDTGSQGVGPIRFTITRVHATKLLPGYVAVRVRARGTLSSGKKVDQVSYAIYQRIGNVLSGVYSFGPNTPQQLQFALHAAQQSAAMLRKSQKSSGPPA
jgi:hypothetical protein